jgi:putative ATP-dependent endonuclease of the OLD family
MCVVRLSVQNFRNLADVSVPISHGTVIVGENRAGEEQSRLCPQTRTGPYPFAAQRQLRREDFREGLRDGIPDWDPSVSGDVVEISVDIDDLETEPAVLAALALAVAETEPLTARTDLPGRYT